MTKKTIVVKKDEVSGEFYFDMNDFKDIVDIEQVVYYELATENETMSLKFFDKDKQLIIPNKNN